MTFTLRPYQQEASDRAVAFFRDKRNYNAVEMLATASGKSLIIADIAAKLKEPVLIFQPSKEILQQNFEKYLSYGHNNASVYSASMNSKEVSEVTFATIGSVKNHPELFSSFKHVIVDECHLMNPSMGMYKTFLEGLQCKVLGLTATPYRLQSYQGYGCILKFITRSRPRIFSELIYYVQTCDLMNAGFLTRPNYFSVPPPTWNEGRLQLNSTGQDYTDQSVKDEYERADYYKWLVSIVRRLLNPKSGVPRKGILVFTRFIEEAERLTHEIPGCAIVTGETPKADRDELLRRFKEGDIKVIANVGVLTTGFDYSELDTVVMARPTRSLAQYYQIIGRVLRLRKDGKPKDAWFVDICKNYERFGKVEDMKLFDENGRGKWAIWSNGRKLTNVFF